MKDATTALILHLKVKGGTATAAAAATAASQQAMPTTLLLAGADHGDLSGEAAAERAVKSLMRRCAASRSSCLLIDEFVASAQSHASVTSARVAGGSVRSAGNVRNVVLRMEPAHSTYMSKVYEPVLSYVVGVYKEHFKYNKKHAAKVLRSFGPARPSQQRLLQFVTARDSSPSPFLRRQYRKSIALARLALGERRPQPQAAPVEAVEMYVDDLYRRVIADALRELSPHFWRQSTHNFTSNCGLWIGPAFRISAVFAAFRASIDVNVFLTIRRALRMRCLGVGVGGSRTTTSGSGSGAVVFHAGRSHLKNVLTLLQEHGLTCKIEPGRGVGACEWHAEY